MKRMTPKAEELDAGDVILLPRVTVSRVILSPESKSVGVVTTSGYPVGYKYGDVVGILRPEDHDYERALKMGYDPEQDEFDNEGDLDCVLCANPENDVAAAMIEHSYTGNCTAVALMDVDTLDDPMTVRVMP